MFYMFSFSLSLHFHSVLLFYLTFWWAWSWSSSIEINIGFITVHSSYNITIFRIEIKTRTKHLLCNSSCLFWNIWLILQLSYSLYVGTFIESNCWCSMVAQLVQWVLHSHMGFEDFLPIIRWEVWSKQIVAIYL